MIHDITTATSLGEDLVALSATVDGLLVVAPSIYMSQQTGSGSGHSKQASKRQAAAAAHIVKVLDRFLYPTVRAVQVANRSLVLQDGANEAGLVISQWLLKRVIQWTSEAPSPLALSDRMIRSWFRFHNIVGTLSTIVVLVTSVPHAMRILLRYGRLSDPFIASQIRLCAFGIFQLAIGALHVISKEGRDASLTNLITTGALATLQCALSCLRGLAQLFRAFVVSNDAICQEVLDWEFQVATRVIQFVQRRGGNQRSTVRAASDHKQQLPGHTLHDGGSSFRCILRRMCFRPPTTKTAAENGNGHGSALTSADTCREEDSSHPNSCGAPKSPAGDDSISPWLETSSSDRLSSDVLLQSTFPLMSPKTPVAPPPSSPRAELEIKMMDYCRLMQPILFERFVEESPLDWTVGSPPASCGAPPPCRMCRHDETLAEKLTAESQEHSAEYFAQETFPHYNDAKSAFLVRRRVWLQELSRAGASATTCRPTLERRGSDSGSCVNVAAVLEASLSSSHNAAVDMSSELVYLKHSNIGSLMTIILPEQFLSALAPLVASLTTTTPVRSTSMCPHMRQLEEGDTSRNRHFVLEMLIRRVWMLTPSVVGSRIMPSSKVKRSAHLAETTSILIDRLSAILLGDKDANNTVMSKKTGSIAVTSTSSENSFSALPQSSHQQQLASPVIVKPADPQLPTPEQVQEAVDLSPALRATVRAGNNDTSLADIHLRLMVVILTFLDRSLIMSPPPIVQLVDALVTLLLAAEQQTFATKRLCALSGTRELVLRAFGRCRCPVSVCCTSKSIREKMFEFASRLRVVYPPVGMALESSLAQGAAIPRSAVLTNNKNNVNISASGRPTNGGGSIANSSLTQSTMTAHHHSGDAPAPRCPFAPANISGSTDGAVASPSLSPHFSAAPSASPALPSAPLRSAAKAHDPWTWWSLSLPVLMGNLSGMWLCSLAAHILPESLRPTAGSAVLNNGPRSNESSMAVRVTHSREIVAGRHYGSGDGLGHVTEFFRSIVSTLRSIVAIYRRASSNAAQLQLHPPSTKVAGASRKKTNDTKAAVEAFVTLIVLPTLGYHHIAAGASPAPLATLATIVGKIDDGFTRGSVTLSGTVQQRLLQFHFMLKDTMADNWKRRVRTCVPRSLIRDGSTLLPVATTKDLSRHLATVISGTHNYSVITRFSADQLEPYNAFGALLLRMAAAPALLLLQKVAEGAPEKLVPETTLLNNFIPSLLQTRFQLRDIIDQYPNQRMAASLLKELGTAAVRAIHSWTMYGIPLADASNGVRSNTPSRFPFCAAGLRSRIMVDLLTCDMFRPLYTNDPLQVLGQVRLQLVDWLCRENRRHLVDLAGGTITPVTMRHLFGDGGGVDASPSGMHRRVGFPPVSILNCLPSPSSSASPASGCPARMPAISAPDCSAAMWAKLLPLASQLSAPDNARVLTVADLFQRRLAHGKVLQQNHKLLIDSSNPLQIMATVQLCFEETRWRCVTNTEMLPGTLGASLDEACRFTATLIEPWCMSLCPPEPTTAWSVRCPFMLDPSSRGRVERATSQQRCPWLRRGAEGGSAPPSWAPPSIASASASSSPTSASNASSRGQCFLLLPWWDAVRCLNQSRWLGNEATIILLHGSRQAVRDLIVLHRARVALLALLSARGSQIFPPHSKVLALLQSVPTVEWLPVLEQLLSIAASLSVRGDHDGAQLVLKLLESTSCDFPEQAVWYLLMRQNFRHNHNAYYNASTASAVPLTVAANNTADVHQMPPPRSNNSSHINNERAAGANANAPTFNAHLNNNNACLQQQPPNSSATLQLHQARIAAELLYAVTARSHEQRLLVETMTLVHRILRGIAVLPVEQLVTDVKFLSAAVVQCEQHVASSSTTTTSTTTIATTPSHTSLSAVEMLCDVQRHFEEFDQHVPTTEFERFMRIELLPFVRQIVQAMTKHHLDASMCQGVSEYELRRSDVSGPSGLVPFDMVALMRECAPYIASLKDRLDSIMSTLTRTVSLSSIVSEKQLSQLTALLSQRGVVLLDVRDLVHMSPGLWPTHRHAVASRAMHPLLTVFPSAQRPKRVTFQSSGESNQSTKRTMSHFLVKGHEDLRQDQRLQRLLRVFALTAPHTMLRLSTYSVIPLSTTSGLVEWVPESETVGRLIQQYRGLAGIPMQREAIMIRHLAATSSGGSSTEDMQLLLARYDTLEAHDKLRVFRILVPPKLASPALATRRLSEIGGVNRSMHCELHHMLLSGAQTAASFLSRRRAFLESLATMSVLGDVIGLGDRHPSNILVDKNAFHVTHIDFGDAFGIAQRRSRFPEHVPFRATRMLERCLGVDGFGTVGSPFQLACANVGCMFADGDNKTSWLRGTLVLELLLPFLDEDDAAVSSVRVPGVVAMSRVATNMAAYTAPVATSSSSPNPSRPSFYAALSKRMCSAYTRCSSRGSLLSASASHLDGLADDQTWQAAAMVVQRWWRSSAVLLRRRLDDSLGGETAPPPAPVAATTFVDEVEVHASSAPVVVATHSPTSCLPTPPPPVSRGPTLGSPFTVAANVQRLVEIATLDENVSRHYSGWNPFW